MPGRVVDPVGHDARLALTVPMDSRESGKTSLACGFLGAIPADAFSMTHHVECVAILKPAPKRS
ncbi:hypothetical protein SAMN05192584_11639 [Streptomyces pini]|uniref:Uncharacterized protein n=1 Tax=Streptomyces pini TaxID=1520580 RepID=A0A1I4GFY9_9ACTN|nr:hypothetical protein SAMN05192584_11639 [Streptomyces pini]